MATWDGPDLLTRLQRELQLEDSDERADKTTLYPLLESAQRHWLGVFATHDGTRDVNLARAQATSGDGGYTYTLAGLTDPPLCMLARDGRQGPVLIPGEDYQNVDFTPFGTTFTMPSNRTRTFAQGLWVLYISPGGTIDDSTAPTLQPTYARELIVYEAAALWASQGNLRDPSPYWQKAQRRAFGDPRSPGDVGIVGQLKSGYAFRGLSAGLGIPLYWWQAAEWIR